MKQIMHTLWSRQSIKYNIHLKQKQYRQRIKYNICLKHQQTNKNKHQ